MVERREPKPRGGAAKEIRTGRFIRDWLEKVEEDSIVGIHGALKSEIGRRNLRRPKARWLKAPTYESFSKYFGHLRRLGLVEFVREEPTEWVRHDKLISIRMVGPWPDDRPLPATEVVPSTRRVYRLSALGRQPELDMLWDDPLVRGLFREVLMGGGVERGGA
ncbi:hypothetical protein ES703_118413 [subsurface metagenome]